MYRLSKYQGYDSFKKFDLIQLRKDGNQAISKELHEIEKLKLLNPKFSLEELIILNQKPEGIEVENKKTNQKLNPAKFKIESEYIHIFEQESFYNYISAYFLEDNISFSDFKTFFIYGKVLNKEIRFTENNFYATRLLYTLKEFFKKFEIKHILENQIVKNDLGKRLNEKDISQAKRRYKFKKINDLEGKIIKILSYK